MSSEAALENTSQAYDFIFEIFEILFVYQTIYNPEMRCTNEKHSQHAYAWKFHVS